MKLLLDTHVFLWFITADPQLPVAWRDAIRDPGNTVYLSIASVWEALIKSQLGKLPLPGPAEVFLPHERRRHGIRTVLVSEGTLVQLAQLPPLHRDPFDRLIISHARQHGLTLMTDDAIVKGYPVTVFV